VTHLGQITFDARPPQRQRVRRKTFELVRALGAPRDLATRIAADVSDVIRYLSHGGAGGLLGVWLDSSGPEGVLELRFTLSDPNTDTPTAPAGAPFPLRAAGYQGGHMLPALRYALRLGGVDPERVASARAGFATRSREELFAQLAASNAALQRSTADAERASATKAQFLANMSHEIRTPMNAIIGLTRLVLRSELSDQQRDQLEKIDMSARHLLGITDDILDVSKLEAGKLQLEDEAVDLPALLAEVEALQAEACRVKGLELKVVHGDDVPTFVRGDALRLRQVLVNLVSNAVKFTERGGVRLQVSRSAACDGGNASDDTSGHSAGVPSSDRSLLLRFEVHDTGIGIGPAELRGLFTSFTQADATITRRYGGTGLGLAICKSLVELMGGEIGVESEPERGSTFWFTARLGAADGVSGREPAAADAAQALPALDPRSRILVAEDNAINREIAEQLLADLGLRATFVVDGLQALEALRREPFDLVLMDVQMPVMDGITATRRIRRESAWRDVPVIALTASALRGDREVCLAAGMNAFVTKPIDPDALERTLRTWLSVSTSASPEASVVTEPVQASEPASEPASEQVAAQASVLAPEPLAEPTPQPAAPLAPAPAADPLAALRDSGVFDVERGLRFTRGNPVLYLRLLRGFVAEERDLPERLGASLAAGDHVLAERYAHTLRGLASGLGISALAERSEILEAALRGGQSGETLTRAAEALLEAHAAFTAAVETAAALDGDAGTAP